jgi:beta-glucosidase
LEGFQKVFLAPGEEKNVQFTITPAQLAIINERSERVLEPGTFQLYVGGKQPGMTGSADNPGTNVIQTEIEYMGPFETH